MNVFFLNFAWLDRQMEPFNESMLGIQFLHVS